MQMQSGTKAKVEKDITSGKKRLYAKAGEVVTIFNTEHSPVLLVVGAKGERFPVHSDHLQIIS